MHRSSIALVPRVRAALLLVALLTLMLLAACGSGAEAAGGVAAAVTPTLSPQAAQGKTLFGRECASCHSTAPDMIIVGPSLAGIATRAGERVPNQDARTYLYTAVLQPGDYIVEGFQNAMPANFGKQLTGEEIDAIIAYLSTLE